MSDNKGMRNSPDNKRIDVNDSHELRNWAMSFNVTEEELRRAVERVGTSAEKVKEHLQTKH
jgi:methyl-accepting chemotaxis protein